MLQARWRKKMKRFYEGWFFFLALFVLLSVDGKAETSYVSVPSKQGCPKNSIMLVSFNAKDFGDTKSTKELEYLASLLKEADIIQLQEVVAKKGGSNAVARFDQALDNLTGASWDYHVSEPTLGATQERMATLFKTANVSFFKPKSGLVKEFDDLLLRDPYLSLFRIQEHPLAVYSFHLAPTKKDPEHEASIVATKGQFTLVRNMFLVGDFNLSGRKLEPYFEERLGFTRHVDGKTSLKTKVDTKGGYLKSEYDSIYSKGGIQVCKAGIVDFVPDFIDLKSARSLSDHLPVFVVFHFK